MISVAVLLAPVLASADAAQQPEGDNAKATYTVRGRASGLHGSVALQLKGGAAITVATDGAFVLPTPLVAGNTFTLEVTSAPVGFDCHVTPASGKVAGADVRVELRCAEAGLAARPVLPAEHAEGVSPLLGRVVLVVTHVMAQPPGGTFLLEARDGEAWTDTGLGAAAEYKPDSREWSFSLDSHLFPAKRILRVTIVPSAGKDANGKMLPRTPVRWTFTTGANPLDHASDDKLKGGCPTGLPGAREAPEKAKPAAAPQPLPCDTPAP